MEAKLAVLNSKIDAMQKELLWLVAFVQEVKPRVENLDKIDIYAQIIPELQSVIEDLRLELRLKEERQHNTALIYGKATVIRARTNPPRVEVRTAIGNVFTVEIPEDLFDIAILKIASTIVIEARLKNHYIPKKGIFTIFHATRIEVINSGTVDENYEARYNDI